MSTTESNETQTAESAQSKLKRWWPLIALAVVVAALIVGERAFQRARNRGWTTYNTDDGLYVLAIAAAPDGAVWVGTTDGVYLLDGDTWTTYTYEDGLAADLVRSIAVAPDGALWVGTLRGVSRFDGQAWTTYMRPDGLAGDKVVAIAVAPDGALWFGTDAGASRFDGMTWTTYTDEDGLVGNDVTSIAVAPDGALWFGARWAGISTRVDGEAWTTHTSSDGGISRFDGEAWTTSTNPGVPGSSRVEAIAVAPDGSVWVGTEKVGVFRFDGETWTAYTTKDGLLSNWINSAAVAPDGALWFATSIDGVSRFDGENWNAFTTVGSGLSSDWVNALAFDDQGRLLMGTNSGLCILDERAALPAPILQVWARAWGVARALGMALSVLLAMVWIIPPVLHIARRVDWRTPSGVMPAPGPRAPGEIDKDQISPRTRAWLIVVTAACVLVGLGLTMLSPPVLSASQLLGAVSALTGVYTLIATKGFSRWGSKSSILDRVMAITAWAGLALITVTTLSDPNLSEFFADVTWGTIAVTAGLCALVVMAALARGRRGSWLLLTLGYAAIGAVLTPICCSGWMGSGHLDGSWGGSILGLVGFALSLPGTVVGLVLAVFVGSDWVWMTWGGAVAYGAIGLLIGIILQIIRKATVNERDS